MHSDRWGYSGNRELVNDMKLKKYEKYQIKVGFFLTLLCGSALVLIAKFAN
jgi:hypothetical protein